VGAPTLARLTGAFAQPLVVDRVELRVTLRAGIAVYPSDGATGEALTANAETALNTAKQTGQRYLFYAPHMNDRNACDGLLQRLFSCDRLKRQSEARGSCVRRVRGAISRMAQLCLLVATAGRVAVTQAGILLPDRHGMMH